MEPVYHLCADLDIAPPPKGRLHLGSVLANVAVATRDSSPDQPLNHPSRITLPASEAPRWILDEGFSATVGELRTEKRSVWAALVGKEGSKAGGKQKRLSKRSEDEVLAVDGVHTLEFLQLTKGEKPLYVVTGLKVVVGAALAKKGDERKELGVAVPAQEGNDSGGFGGQKAFVLGYRTLRMTWTVVDKLDSKTTRSKIVDMENWKFEENAVGPGEIVEHHGGYGIGPSTWIFPKHVHRGTGSFVQFWLQFTGMSGLYYYAR